MSSPGKPPEGPGKPPEQSGTPPPGVPFLRPPVPGQNKANGDQRARTPRLGLAIPPSPNQKAVNGPSTVPELAPLRPPGATGASSGRPLPPALRIATPSGTSSTPQDAFRAGGIGGAGTDANGRNRSNSGGFGMLDGSGRLSGPNSASSLGHSSTSFPNGSRTDPNSSISSMYSHDGGGGSSMEREGSRNELPDLSKLSLEKGRELDADDLHDDNAWLAASKDGRIEEVGTLGEGTGGAVTKCKLKGGTTVVALKIITTDPDPDMQKQIRRELEFNRKIQHDNICKYYGAFGDPLSGIISIVMEYCEGGSLDSVYKEVKKLGGRIGEKVLGKIAEGVLEGLTALYKCKIIHRDIKPSNILLTRDGRVKLCDFGVSGEFGTRGDADTFIGTSYYMAPERITGQSYTINSDVWSLGVTLLEVAQHRFPFPADGTEMQPRAGLIDIIQYIVGQPLPKLKDEPARDGEPEIKWSANFKYFIECCLEKEPARRATPWRMLEHPWMVEMKAKKVNMGSFLHQVWEWKD